ncbi:MAG TPA: FtsX-like permease family protein [Candidatus Binatia bacterium]|nr:FtsX-like permease family protein [Candidatus Binatia bacterium]
MRWQLMIGARYLRSRRRELFVSLIALIAGIGVAIGVMTLCIVMAVMAGFEEDLRERILGFSPHIVLLSHGGLFEPEPDLLAKVRETPGVVAAAPFVYSQAMATTPGSVGGAIVRGVDPSHIDDVIDVSAHVRDGSAAGLGQPMSVRTLVDGEETTVEAPQAIIGFELAKLLGVKVGDWINLVSPLGSPTALGFVPRVKRFAVGAVFDSGMFEYDSTIVFLALPDAQRFLEMGSKITGIEVAVASSETAGDVARELEVRVGYPYYARDWMQVNRNVFVAFRLQNFVQFIVLMLIILVAGFNIAATLIMVVMEKRKDIAILKSMGASQGAIATIFIVQGAVIGVLGTALGILGGLGGSLLLAHYHFIDLPKDVFYVSTVPVRIHPENFALVAAASFLICLLATIYPARQAARLPPVEVIRHE